MIINFKIIKNENNCYEDVACRSGSDKMTYSAEIEVSDDVLSLATVNLQDYEAVRVRGTCMMRIFYKSLMKALNLGQDTSRIFFL